MAGDPPLTDLTLASTDEIVDELARRNTCVLVVLMKDARNTDKDEAAETFFRGGFYSCVGLTEWAKHHLLNRKEVEHS